jgi:hypothetical protein
MVTFESSEEGELLRGCLIPKGLVVTLPLLGEGIRGVVKKGGTLDECNGMLQTGTDS